MLTPRAYHSATVLQDGTVLVAGGTLFYSGASASGTPTMFVLASAEVFVPASGAFTSTAPMDTARSGHTATLLQDGRVLVAGGTDLPSAELFDPATRTFTATGPMTAARSGHSATLLSDGKVLLAGGYQLASMELFDPATGTFVAAGAMTTARYFHSTTLLSDGRVFVAGGVGTPSWELYDLTTQSSSPGFFDVSLLSRYAAVYAPAWRSDEVPPVAAMRLADGRVMIATGWPGTQSAGGVYDPMTGAFVQPTGSFPVSLYDPTDGTVDERVLPLSIGISSFSSPAVLLPSGNVLFAGVVFSGTQLGVDGGVRPLYSAASKIFKPNKSIIDAAGMSVARFAHTMSLLQDGRVLIAGGYVFGESPSIYDSVSWAEIYY
jgi:hypothetical protein